MFIFRTISQPRTLSADIPAARRGLFTNYSPVMPTGRLRACKTSFGLLALFLSLVPYGKQLNNLDRSIVTGKSQTSAYRIDQYGRASV